MRTLALVGMSLALGCGSPPVPPDCSTVGAGVHKYWADRAATEATDDVERQAMVDTARETAARFERHCREDQWNAEMIACARAVFRLDDSGCMKFLSTQQRARWERGEAAPVPGGVGVGVGP